MEEMLKDNGLSFNGSKVIVSGSGNVAIYAMEKAISLGAKIIACSDSNGYIYDPEGIKLETVKEIKEVRRGRISEYVKVHPKANYVEDPRAFGRFHVILLYHVPRKMKLPMNQP